MNYYRIKASIWAKEYSKPNAISINTVKSWIDSGLIAGRRIGTTYFVFCHKNYEPLDISELEKKSPTVKPKLKVKSTGNSIADQIIKRQLKQCRR